MDLTYFARKYIWWQTPDSAAVNARRIFAQVMNIGTFEDAQALLKQAGEAELRRVLHEARPGEFSDRSWHYWHLVLGEARLDAIPPLPVRRFA